MVAVVVLVVNVCGEKGRRGIDVRGRGETVVKTRESETAVLFCGTWKGAPNN